MHNNRIKVLIVDDSAFMRNVLTKMIASDHDFRVVGTARDGVEAVDKVLSLRPDIVTLDVEMPRMNGIEALKLIMDKHPLPVLMVSSLTTEGAETTLEALELGAVDFIPKNLADLSVNIVKIKEHLLNMLKTIGRRKIVPGKRLPTKSIIPKRRSFDGQRKISVVAIGSSTGGPRALQEILPQLPENFPVPVVISQHMPKNFTGPFAERLNQISRIRIKEAEDGDILHPGTVLLAPGGSHLKVERTKAIETVVRITPDNGESIYKPSVDIMMEHISAVFPGRTLGVILTGMGHDGLEGMKNIKTSGGRTIAQNEDTCVVYGMPKAVVDAGIADKVVPLEEISGEIINYV